MSQSARASGRAILALLAIALIWGYNWVQMKIAVQYASPFLFAAVRNIIAGLCLLPFVAGLVRVTPWVRAEEGAEPGAAESVASGRGTVEQNLAQNLALNLAQNLVRSLPLATLPGVFLLGLLQTGGMYGLSSWALVSGGAGKTAVLVYTMPFWGLLFASIWLKERIAGLQWLAIALSMAGFLSILEPQSLEGTAFSKVLAMSAGICWAAGSIVFKKLRQGTALDVLSLTTGQMILGGAFLAVIVCFLPNQAIDWTPPFLFALFYSTVPGTVIAQFLWFYALDNLPSGIAGLGTLFNPVLGVLFAALQLGERPNLLELIGMSLIAIALILNTIQACRLKPQP